MTAASHLPEELRLSELRFDASAIPETGRELPRRRRAFAAAHVVADPRRAAQPVTSDHVDWEATLRLRHEIWSFGLGVAESMDTAQRGMGLNADDAMTLARLTMAEDPFHGDGVVVGITTDALPASESPRLQDIADAYLRQLEVVEAGGATAVMMASRHLTRVAQSPEDYLFVYDQVISASRRIILHWLGDVFDPALRGYWGVRDPQEGVELVADLIRRHSDRVVGIKVSLLDPLWEVALREVLPESVVTFTGDDFNYVDMIAGDGRAHSHALLGAFAFLAPFASAALARLDADDEAGFRRILAPTQPLSRLVFESPTQFYKVGVAWLAYVSGRQTHFRMLGGLESGRSLAHLFRVTQEAGRIGLFADPDLARSRALAYFAIEGIR